MSQNKKIVLFVVLPVIGVCCLLCVIGAIFVPTMMLQAVSDNPAKAKAVAAQIADYTLPDGYEESMGMDMFFEQMVMISRPDKRGFMIALIQLKTTNASRDQMEQQMRQAFQNQLGNNYGGMQYVGTRSVTIKGQPATISISETNAGSEKVRQATGTFPGKGGLAMVMVSGSTSAWDWNMLDTFFQSIK